MLNEKLEYVAPCNNEGIRDLMKRHDSSDLVEKIIHEVTDTDISRGGVESTQLVIRNPGYYHVVVKSLTEAEGKNKEKSWRSFRFRKSKRKKSKDDMVMFELEVQDVHHRHVLVHAETGEGPHLMGDYYLKTLQEGDRKTSGIASLSPSENPALASAHANFFVNAASLPASLHLTLSSNYNATLHITVSYIEHEMDVTTDGGKDIFVAAMSGMEIRSPRSAQSPRGEQGITSPRNQGAIPTPEKYLSPYIGMSSENSLVGDAPRFHVRKHSYSSATLKLNHIEEDINAKQNEYDISKHSASRKSFLKPLVVKGKWFYEYNGPNEPLGRAILLRGVNLSGATKLPTKPTGDTHLRLQWGDYKSQNMLRQLSFVGRPFPLDEAHEHFTRLRRWGFNCFRFLVTWEAIEHEGPGIYDTDYLDYLERVVGMAGMYGFYVFIDPHQDVWCRATGGSGAPLWTLGVAGLDLAKIEQAEATFTHQSSPAPESFQRMSWPQNYQRFAALHMFTLFWGGNDFAPEFCADGGVPIQQYLQSHYINAILEVVKRVKHMPHVIGFDSFNEPSSGFIGHPLDEYLQPIIPPGPVFKPYEAMAVAGGCEKVVSKSNKIGLLLSKHRANMSRTDVWLEGYTDIWRELGIWDVDPKSGKPQVLKPNYFMNVPGTSWEVNFFDQYLRPFMILYISKIRELMPTAILFAEGEGFGKKEFTWGQTDPQGIVNASHWYDGFTLFTCKFNPSMNVDVKSKMPVFGSSRIYALHYRDLTEIIELPRNAQEELVEMPTLIGEFGIPYNMNDKHGFRTGDFSMHEKALTLYYDLFDALQLHSTQWNYCSDNCNQWGDNWNLEDLSLFSRDQQKVSFNVDPDSGGRAIRGFCRPYVPYVCGIPIMTVFNQKQKIFEHEYSPNSRNFTNGKYRYATEIYVPDIHFIGEHSGVVELDVSVIGGTVSRHQFSGYQMLYVWADESSIGHNRVVRIGISIGRRGELSS